MKTVRLIVLMLVAMLATSGATFAQTVHRTNQHVRNVTRSTNPYDFFFVHAFHTHGFNGFYNPYPGINTYASGYMNPYGYAGGYNSPYSAMNGIYGGGSNYYRPMSQSPQSTPQAAQPSPNQAFVNINLPTTAALVWIDGQKLESGLSATRLYTTPNLEPGQDYAYTVKAQWVRRGENVSQEKSVRVEAGKTSVVDFAMDAGS